MAIIVNGNIIYNIIVFINFEISLFISVIATKLAGNTKKPSNAICSLAIKSQLFSLFNINIININKINVSPIFKIVYIIPTLKRFFNTFIIYSPISTSVFLIAFINPIKNTEST